MKVRVEYECTPIRHIAVECPHCKKWFHARDIFNGDALKNLRYSYEIHFASFTCPVCNNTFGFTDGMKEENIEIEEVGTAEECYSGCLVKKEIWE